MQRLVEQQLQQPPPGYVVQRRESIHVGSCTSDAEEAESAANFELRTVSLTSSESLQIRQFRELRFCSGCRLWDSGVALARWLCNDKEVLHDKEVLELGSGVGLVGLAAARRARRVVLTDGELRLLPNLRRNATEAVPPASARLEVASLNWSHEPAELRAAHGTFDVILGADLVYSSGCVSGLSRAVAALLRPGGMLLLCSPAGRHGLHQFTAALEAKGLCCSEEVVDAALLRDAACQGEEAEVRAHRFLLLRALLPNAAEACMCEASEEERGQEVKGDHQK